MAQFPGGAPYPGAYDPMSLEWSVSITDDDQRTMTSAQLVAEYQRGALDLQDTFVWREGMGDWVPLGQAPELVPLLGGGAPAPVAAPAQEPAEALGSTVMMDNPPGPASPAEAPAAAQAARLGGRAGVDVFEAQGAGPAPAEGRRLPPRRVGERNEASSLFSLDQITGQGAERGKRKVQSATDDLMGLGSGLGAGGIASSAFEPPPLNAPVLTPPPQPKLPPQVEAQLLAAAAQYEPPKKNKTGIIIAAAVIGVLIFGVVTLVVVMQKPDAGPTASNTEGSTATSETSAGPKEGDGETSTDSSPSTETASADSTASPSDSADSTSGAKSGSGTSSTKGSKTDSKDSGSKTSTKDSGSKTDSKDSSSKPEATAAPAAGGAEFNRDAASAAMGSAAGAASGCGQPGGPTGRGRVSVTFAPSGRATNVSVGAPFGGTSVGSCIAAAFKRVSVPPFSGDAITVSKSVSIK